MNNEFVKYNTEDIQKIFDILNNIVIQGLGNAQGIIAIAGILNNNQVKDELITNNTNAIKTENK